MDNNIMVDRDIMIYAFRYALGRQSFAPVTVVENIKHNIDKISDNDLKLYIKEIKEFENYGMEFDKAHWLSFVSYLEKELKSRECS